MGIVRWLVCGGPAFLLACQLAKLVTIANISKLLVNCQQANFYKPRHLK